MKTTFRYLRPLAPIASFAFFVYVLERSGPAAVFDKIRLLGWCVYCGRRCRVAVCRWHQDLILIDPVRPKV